ncbi:M20 aminoacylase family protein [Rhizobium leguminosarum]|uniref:Amidohydrolase n=1 Tax=Rhizobium leguminosarum TaxID=384 RepID=A0A1B1CKH2_RHILE|nr:M20 aminoacylase family protein [Rhizobium leguminosarum]ANP90216.1 amidohydrolase [Rhizobium leguminosarum]
MEIQQILPELVAIRHQLHSFPEIGLSEVETPELIARTLASWGIEVERGLGKTGLVGQISRGSGTRSVGLRADFDALAIVEETGLPYASRRRGVMHACGHDGHVAMLLGAAWLLSQRSGLNGRINLIFQPAEENFGGAKLMIDDGLFDRFPCDRIFALHNLPGLEVGAFATRKGAIAASADVVKLTVRGKGGHGAMPEATVDPIIAGASIAMALQTLVSRGVEACDAAVLTIGSFHGGVSSTIIPDSAELLISIRATRPDTRALLCSRVEQIATMQAASFGADVKFEWDLGYPATVNDDKSVELVRQTITARSGSPAFRFLDEPKMFSEDFSFMLEKVPGAYVLVGNGDSSALHTSTYDFNDACIGHGGTYLADIAALSLSS